MSRYINADHYAERLRQLRLAYSGRVLEIHAAFLTPISPVFKPVFKEPQEVSEDGTD